MSPGSETIVSVGPGPIFVLLLLAAGSALFLAKLYRQLDGKAQSGSGLHAAFPLMAVALTALFLTVQVSLPLSIGLLAALTVIRFRTPVKEPEEIAFVMAIIAVAATLATFRLALAGVLLASAVLAGLATRALRARRQSVQGLLLVSLPSGGPEQGPPPAVWRPRLSPAIAVDCRRRGCVRVSLRDPLRIRHSCRRARSHQAPAAGARGGAR